MSLLYLRFQQQKLSTLHPLLLHHHHRRHRHSLLHHWLRVRQNSPVSVDLLFPNRQLYYRRETTTSPHHHHYLLNPQLLAPNMVPTRLLHHPRLLMELIQR